VSHSTAWIRILCGRVIWLEKGKMLMDGPVETVLAAYKVSIDRQIGETP